MKKRYPEPRTQNLSPDVNPNNVTWFDGYVNKEDREKLHGHRGAAIWFTGLSASGKSTIAHHLEKLLYEKNCSTYVFDGDNVRHGLCGDKRYSIPKMPVANNGSLETQLSRRSNNGPGGNVMS